MDGFDDVRLAAIILYGLAIAWHVYATKWRRYGTSGPSDRVTEQTYKRAQMAFNAAGLIFLAVNVMWLFGVAH